MKFEILNADGLAKGLADGSRHNTSPSFSLRQNGGNERHTLSDLRRTALSYSGARRINRAGLYPCVRLEVGPEVGPERRLLFLFPRLQHSSTVRDLSQELERTVPHTECQIASVWGGGRALLTVGSRDSACWQAWIVSITHDTIPLQCLKMLAGSLTS